MFTWWVIVLLTLMAVELASSSGDASVWDLQQHPAGMDQTLRLGLWEKESSAVSYIFSSMWRHLGKIIGNVLCPEPRGR